jgi:cobalt/nickel transport system permease protein
MIFLFVVLVLFAKDISVIFCIYLFCLALAAVSKIKPGYFLKRTWIFIPLFSLFIAIPAMFDIIIPGRVLFGFKILGLKLAVTHEGLHGAALFVTRVITSVSFVILLSMTTKHNELLKVLRVFKIPQIFVMTIGMCYRYIYLFVEMLEHTFLAIKSRVGVSVHHKKGRKLVAWNMANLWLKSYNLNSQVYNAMLSKGYSGEPQVLSNFKTSFIDWLWVGLTGIVLIGILIYKIC